MNILITGATGQIGSELVPHLRANFPEATIIATYFPRDTVPVTPAARVVTSKVDVTQRPTVDDLMRQYQPDQIYHLAGILSASGERDPQLAWETNLVGLKNILDGARGQKTKIFWPSSIAAFGPSTPRDHTPQRTIMEPNTMYGLTKLAGELLCQYYTKTYGLDIRSLRFPGLISYTTSPGGGTTDYAVEMFYQAILQQRYTCFVSADTILPMMYMADALLAIDLLMAAPRDKLTIRTSYNVTALDFSAAELARKIQQRLPKFECSYQPDFRQDIADGWPKTIDDTQAATDWNWRPEFTLDRMVDDMLLHLRSKLNPKQDQ